jgi:hypothetical protein
MLGLRGRLGLLSCLMNMSIKEPSVVSTSEAC